MARRVFAPGYFSIASTGTPQPLIGTTTSASVAASWAPQSVPVASSAMFAQGDLVVVTDTSKSPAVIAKLQVASVPDSTHVVLTSQQGGGVPTLASGTFVQLATPCNNVTIQCKATNTAALVVGCNPAMSTSTGAYSIAVLAQTAAGSQPNMLQLSESQGANLESAADYWIAGTAGDSYLASLGLM